MFATFLICAFSNYAIAQDFNENVFENGYTSSESRLFSDNLETKNYLVINGIANHFSKSPDMMGKWNQRNYGLSYQHSFKEQDSSYRYSLEGGFFKESFGKTATYFAAGMLKDLTTSPRISVGSMLGISYRINNVYDDYYSYHLDEHVVSPHTPILAYRPKSFTPMLGLMAQIEVPHTKSVLQLTFLPKIASDSSAVLFFQLLFGF